MWILISVFSLNNKLNKILLCKVQSKTELASCFVASLLSAQDTN